MCTRTLHLIQIEFGGENMKDTTIKFRLTTAEKEQIRKEAKEANMTLTQYMRYKIFGK